jgi:uncharacterized integral membrane protein (TIGR00698 family)
MSDSTLAPSANRPGQEKPTSGQPGHAAIRVLPGLALVAAVVAVSFGVNSKVHSLSPLVCAVGIGALLSNLGVVPQIARPGLRFAAKRLIRLGIVLFGFQLAFGDVVKLGPRVLLVVCTVVAATFFGTQWLGRRLGVSRELSLLTATGFSICGASAIAAVEGVSDAKEEDVVVAVGLVTLCGTLAILVLPLLQGPLGLSDRSFGMWVGASVHDVAQVVATSSVAGPAALSTALVVKLTRVALLAPIVAGVSLSRRRIRGQEVHDGPKPPILPLFVIGFLATMAARTIGLVPIGAISGLKTLASIVLAAALVGLGAGVEVAKLRRVGVRPVLLGLLSWVLVAGVAYVGVAMVS